MAKLPPVTIVFPGGTQAREPLAEYAGVMEIPLYQVDAFTNRLFGGNPAAVCPLDQWLNDDLLQNIALENNLAETAYFVPSDTGYHLRWFTPACEVDLCGHATLASAWVITNLLKPGQTEVSFETRSGELKVSKQGDVYTLDFPALPPRRVALSPDMTAALGIEPAEVWQSRDLIAVFETEQQIRALSPDVGKIAALPSFALIVTAPGAQFDFVSRFFAPAKGVPEDPVTGSAHCSLVPYWAGRLGKNTLRAWQASRRGGELFCELNGERVKISGNAVLYSTGTIYLPEVDGVENADAQDHAAV